MSIKYKSQNPSVAKALNSSWLWLGLPFFGGMIGFWTIGFLLMAEFGSNQGWEPPLVIFGSLFAAGYLTHQVSKFWFAKQISQVTDLREFVERATRRGMILAGTADKILEKKGLVLPERKIEWEGRLPLLRMSDRLSLTDDGLQIGRHFFAWTRIKEFRLDTPRRRYTTTFSLVLIFTNGKAIDIDVGFEKNYYAELEYQIDRYLHNKRAESAQKSKDPYKLDPKHAQKDSDH